jgi:hypothetical protein
MTLGTQFCSPIKFFLIFFKFVRNPVWLQFVIHLNNLNEIMLKVALNTITLILFCQLPFKINGEHTYFFILYSNYLNGSQTEVTLAMPSTILPIIREITHIKNVKKCIILESNQECSKGLLSLPMMQYRYLMRNNCFGFILLSIVNLALWEKINYVLEDFVFPFTWAKWYLA